ncbi:MAG: hypothetical protein JEZ07_00820 [Phycisphaerae bacterium]|nr:hypothetical protein [Phycisphaerae bacterium]
MSQQQQKLTGLSSNDDGVNRTNDEINQMVPVTESIKYRKRAQTAEQQVEYLTSQLQVSQQQQNDLQQKYQETKLENELTAKLAQCGAVDIEAAILLARKNLEAGDVDIKSVIEQMQIKRPYLFASNKSTTNLGSLTAGVRSGKKVSENVIDNLAHQAQQSGSRRDMQQYLKMRRAIRS